jgi:Flp pilus assembly protein TadG
MMKVRNQRTVWRPHNASQGAAAGIENTDQGSTTVEFAICAVLLFTVLFGIIDFSRALYTYHFLSNSAREATRYAIVRGSACTSWASACPAGGADIQNYVQSLAAPSTGLITPTAITATTTWTPNNEPGSQVSVQVRYVFRFILPFLPSSGITMQSTSQMVIAR